MSKVVWTDEGSILRWCCDRLLAILPERKTRATPAESSVACYSTTFRAPVKSRRDLQKAVELALPQLMPVAPAGLAIFARRAAGGAELAAFRSEDFLALSKLADRRGGSGIRVSSAWTIPARERTQPSSRIRALTGAGAVAAVGALAVIYTNYVGSLTGTLDELLQQERAARASAVAHARQKEDADLWASLEAQQASARLPAAMLARIAEVSRSTPDTAYWTAFDWSPTGMSVRGAGADPVSVLGAYSALTGLGARFSRPVTPSKAGRQEFEIELTAKGSDK
jgi:hypothetical protein